MIITAWRITQSIHADNAFTGIGAWLEGGRWNQKGVHMVYTAQSLSLAALEMVVHLPEDTLLYQSYVRIPVQFDSDQVIDLAPSTLPEDWNSNPPPASTQRIGSAWIYERSSLALKVPSSIIPTEHNYLINPLHPDAAELNIGTPEPFRFDSRLTH